LIRPFAKKKLQIKEFKVSFHANERFYASPRSKIGNQIQSKQREARFEMKQSKASGQQRTLIAILVSSSSWIAVQRGLI
jgi:hypothetical protein